MNLMPLAIKAKAIVGIEMDYFFRSRRMKAMVKKSVVVSSTLLVASYSNAALYRVVLEESPVETESVYGVAVEPELGTTDCFSTSCGDTDYAFAGKLKMQNQVFPLKRRSL